MKRQEAIDVIVAAADCGGVLVSSLGLISREIYERHDSANKFYVPGSMGLTSSIGLGIALSQPDTAVFVVEGDGSLLMNLGAMVTVGNCLPAHFVHIVLDNTAYASCNEERSLSSVAHLETIATVVGYRYTRVAESQEALCEALRECAGRGPAFILARIELGGRRDFARPLQLERLGRRFTAFLSRGDTL